MMLAIFADVTLRFFFNRPITWVFEGTEYSLLYITFLGAAWLLKRGGHVRIDVLLISLKPRPRAILNIITSILLAIICLFLFWYSAETTWDLHQRGVEYIQYHSIPKAALLAAIPVGSFLLFIQAIKRTYGYLIYPEGKKTS